MQDMLTELLDNCLSYQLDDLHTMLPAVIIAIDYTTRKVSVQPTIKKRKRDGDSDAKGLQDMAIIQNVPLVTPASKLAMLSIPVKVGDEVLLGFFERSVDNYLYSDGSKPIDPQDYRKHDYNDAVAIIGLNTFKSALGMHPENVVLLMNADTSKECKLSLTPSGEVVIDSPLKITLNGAEEVNVNTTKANITASDSVKIDSPQTTCTGDLRVDGEVSTGGDVHTDAGISLENSRMIGNLGKMTSKMLPA